MGHVSNVRNIDIRRSNVAALVAKERNSIAIVFIAVNTDKRRLIVVC